MAVDEDGASSLERIKGLYSRLASRCPTTTTTTTTTAAAPSSPGGCRAETLEALRDALAACADAEPEHLWPLLVTGVRHCDRDVRKLTRRAIDGVLEHYRSLESSPRRHVLRIPAATVATTLAAIVASLQRCLAQPAQAAAATVAAASDASMARWLLAVLSGVFSVVAATAQPRYVPSSTEVQSFVDVIVCAMGRGMQQRDLSSASSDRRRSSSSSSRQGPGHAFTFASAASQHASAKDPHAGTSKTGSAYPNLKVEDDSSGGEGGDARRADHTLLTHRIRCEGIQCVVALNTLCQKPLLVHWNTLLLDASASHGKYLGSANTARCSLMDLVERDMAGQEDKGSDGRGVSPSNRIAALVAIQTLVGSGAQLGFFSGAAQEMPSGRRSAFTPFSARMATLVDSLRGRISSLLSSSYSGIEPVSSFEGQDDHQALFAIQLIKCAKTLVGATEDVKLIRSHQDVLLGPTLALCSGSGSMVAVAALSLLSALVSSSGSPKIEPMPGTSSDLEILQLIFRRLASGDCSAEMKVELFGALQSFSQRYPSLFALKAGQVREHLALFFRLEEEESVRMAALGLLRPLSDQVAQDSSLQPFLDRIAEDASGDPSATIRCAIADMLPVLQQGCLRTASPEDRWLLFADAPMQVAIRLASDGDATVRAAVARAAGVAAMDRRLSLAEVLAVKEKQLAALCLAVDLLLLKGDRSTDGRSRKGLLHDGSELVRQRASWSLANFCEVIPIERVGHATAGLSSEALRCWVSLLNEVFELRNEGERICINALRAIGALFGIVRLEWLSEMGRHIEELRWLCCDGIDKWKSPKTRWNAAAAVARALSNSCIVQFLLLKGEEEVLQKVTKNVCNAVTTEKNFKTRLSAARAAEALLSRREELPPHIRTRLEECIIKALRTVDAELNEVSFREAQLHAHPLQKLLQDLVTAR